MVVHVAYLTDEVIEKRAEALLAEYALARSVSIDGPIPIDDIIEKHLKLGIEFDDTHRLFGVPRSGNGIAPDVLGAIIFDEKRIVIDESLDPDVNPTKEGRYRYTAAHEVGHWQLHRSLFSRDPAQSSLLDKNAASSFICRSSQAKERIEVQADLYASSLLMPRRAVRQHWVRTYGTDKPLVFDAIRLQPWANPPKRSGLRPISQVLAGLDRSPDFLFNKIASEFARHFLVSTQAMRIRLEKLGLLLADAPEQHALPFGF